MNILEWFKNRQWPVPEPWFFRECGVQVPDLPNDLAVRSVEYQNTKQYDLQEAMYREYYKNEGITDVKVDEITTKWYLRNFGSNFNNYILGFAQYDLKVSMTNSDPKLPGSPFAHSGFNVITIERTDGEKFFGVLDKLKCITYRNGFVEAYFGFREKGNFAISIRASQRKKEYESRGIT